MKKDIPITEFYNDFMEEIFLASDSESYGWEPQDFFTAVMLGYLEEAGEIEDPIICPFRGYGLQLNAYHISDSYEEVEIFVSVYNENSTLTSVSRTDIDAAVKRGIQLYRRSISDLYSSFEKDSDTYEFAITLHNEKAKIKKANEHVDKIINELDERTSFIRFKLKINCRNTKFIGDEIKCITGFDSGSYIWSKVDGVPVEHRVFDTQEEQKQQLKELISKLVAEGIATENITILSPYKRENSVISGITGLKIKDYTPKGEGAISFSTIQGYKGLENTVIIMTDIESFDHEQLMYVGLSRARSALFIFESSEARKDYLNILKRRFIGDGYKT